MEAITKLFSSKKAIVTIVAIVCTTIMAIAGSVPGSEVLTFLMVVVPAWVGSQAAIDVAAKLKEKK